MTTGFLYPTVNTIEPVFPLTRDVTLPRPLRAPRLDAPSVELGLDARIFPGAWSAQHLPLRRRRTNTPQIEHSAGADALRGLFGEDGRVYSDPASDGMAIIVV